VAVMRVSILDIIEVAQSIGNQFEMELMSDDI
jgi:hypothetical protein